MSARYHAQAVMVLNQISSSSPIVAETGHLFAALTERNGLVALAIFLTSTSSAAAWAGSSPDTLHHLTRLSRASRWLPSPTGLCHVVVFTPPRSLPADVHPEQPTVICSCSAKAGLS